MSGKKVLMAMSGGIDSTMSAILLLEQGYDLVGVTFRSFDTNAETGCCASDAVAEAKQVAESLGFTHLTIDVRETFRNTVIKDFTDEYMRGRTPNPCVTCNKTIKWGALLQLADKENCDLLATGHYARIGCENGRHFIRKATDTSKDQSYFLWRLSSDELARTLFPLGDYTKAEIRQMASDRGYVKLSQKKESQEICFVPDNNYRQFLRASVPDFDNIVTPGNFVDINGKILGKHKGYPNYTIGQRKGLEIALGQPMYVSKIDATANTVTLGTKECLLSDSLTASAQNFTKTDISETPIEVTARVRYRSQGGIASVWQKDGKVHVKFNEPIDSITAGQSVVFYQNEDLIGGAIID